MENDQSCLFNEAEVSADEKTVEAELIEIEKHYRKKARESEGRLTPDLPVEEQICSELTWLFHVLPSGGVELKQCTANS